MTTPEQAPKKPLSQILVKRSIIGIALILLILVPSVVLFAITGQPAATYAALGTLAGAVAVMAGGFRIGVLTTIVITLLAPLAIVAGLSPVAGAALMALMTLMVGRLSRFGLHGAVMLVPILVAWPMMAPVPWLPREALSKINELMAKFGYSLTDALNHHMASASTTAATSAGKGSKLAAEVMTHLLREQRLDTNYLLAIALFFFVGAIVPVLLLPLMTRKMKLPAPQNHPRSEALPYTITITVLATVATFYVLEHPKMTGGSFLIATILVLAQVGTNIKWKLTVQRVVGTFIGVVLMIGIAQWAGVTSFVQVMGVPMPLNLYGIGLVFGTVAVISKFSPRQWIYYILMAPTTACLNAFTFTEASNLGEQRLVDNLVGAALVVAAGVVTLLASRLGKSVTENVEVASL